MVQVKASARGGGIFEKLQKPTREPGRSTYKVALGKPGLGHYAACMATSKHLTE